jgi:hypothetical protein
MSDNEQLQVVETAELPSLPDTTVLGSIPGIPSGENIATAVRNAVAVFLVIAVPGAGVAAAVVGAGYLVKRVLNPKKTEDLIK